MIVKGYRGLLSNYEKALVCCARLEIWVLVLVHTAYYRCALHVCNGCLILFRIDTNLILVE